MVRLKKEFSSQLHSPQSLENSLSRIEQLLSSARRVAVEMERLKTGPILISNQPSFDSALGDLARWGKACEDSLTLKMQEIGYFKAQGTGPAAHPATRRRRRNRGNREGVGS